MKLRMALDEKKLDVRLRDRLVSEGKLDQKEVEEYLKSLDDDSSKAISTTNENGSQVSHQ